MARVTVEDCVTKVPNRFELVLLSAQRARAIAAGAAIAVERDNDKNPVVALREIADEAITPEDLRTALIGGMQKHVEVDEPVEDDMALLMQSGEWAGVQVAQADEETEAEGMSILEGEEALSADASDGEEA